MITRDKSIQHSVVHPRWLFAALMALLVPIGPRSLGDVDPGRPARVVEPLLAKGDEGGKPAPGPVDPDADDEPATFIAWPPRPRRPTPTASSWRWSTRPTAGPWPEPARTS